MNETTINKNAADKKAAMLLFVLLFIPCLLINTNPDNDIWFLLNSGKYVLESGFPHIEPFTMHSGMAFVMQQWLTAVIFRLAYAAFGTAGLMMIVTAVFACAIFAIYKLCMLISDRNFFVSYLLTFSISALFSVFMVTRPYIFSVLIFLLELYILEDFIKTGKKGPLALLPVLSAAQINLQSAMWPMLFVLLIPYAIDSFHFRLRFAAGQGYPKKALFAAAAAMLPAGLINPYGTDAMTYLFRSYGYPEISNYVSEMRPADINNALGILIFSVLLIMILVYCIYRNGRTRVRYVLLTIGTAVLALSSVRNFLVFACCGIFPIAYYLKDAKLPEGKVKTQKNVQKLRAVLVALLCFTLAAALFGKYREIEKTDISPQETAAINYILKAEAGKKLVLYTGYDEGGYAEFRGLKPYIDPRAEVFVKKNNHKDDIMKEYYNLQAGCTYYKDFLNKYGFTCLLVSKNDILYTYLPHDADYKTVYQDKTYRVFEKVNKTV